jgi:hypothetical protein
VLDPRCELCSAHSGWNKLDRGTSQCWRLRGGRAGHHLEGAQLRHQGRLSAAWCLTRDDALELLCGPIIPRGIDSGTHNHDVFWYPR